MLFDTSILCRAFSATALLLPLAVSAQAPDCSKDGSGAVTSLSQCSLQPQAYRITVFRVALCTREPAAPTPSIPIDLSYCTTVFDSPSGKPVDLQKSSQNLLSAGEAGIARPANGSYSHIYFELSPKQEIKAWAKFSTPRQALGTNLGTGLFCWTKNKNNQPANRFGYSFLTPNGLVNCGNAVPEPYGTNITWTNSFAGQSAAVFQTPQGQLKAYLMTDQRSLGEGYEESATPAGASPMGNVTRIGGVVTYPMTVSFDTTGLDLAFNISQGASIEMPSSGPQDPKAGVYISAFPAGPFVPRIQLTGVR